MLCIANANPKPLQSHRTISFHLEDPRNSFDANSSAWQSLNALAGFGADQFSPGSVLTKIGLFSAGFYVNSMLRYYSHEIAHEYAYRQNQTRINNSINFQDWKSSYIPGIYYPSWRQRSLDPSTLDEDDLFSSITAGLNQDELNAVHAWRSNVRRSAHSFYESQSFLLTSLRDLDYIIRSKSEETPFDPGMQIHLLQQQIFYQHQHLYDDVNLYRLMLWNNGIHITNRMLLNRSIFASALSWQTWESLYSLFNYIGRGRSTTPFFFNIHDNLRISPPLFSHFFAKNSSFMNAAFWVKLSELELSFDVGSQLAYSGENIFQTWRFGASIYDVDIMPPFSIKPFVFFSAYQNRSVFISNAGMDGILALNHSLGIWLRLQYVNRDIIENEIKNAATGVRFTFGVRSTL